MKKSFLYTLFLVCLAFGCFLGCDTFADPESAEYQEAPKNLAGDWKLYSVLRNQVDITKSMDFTKFCLHLNDDGTYSIDNYLPFIVKEAGTWSTDDELYPFFLQFTESGSTEMKTIELKYPIINGKRYLSVVVSPGCYNNSYTYSFEQAD